MDIFQFPPHFLVKTQPMKVTTLAILKNVELMSWLGCGRLFFLIDSDLLPWDVLIELRFQSPPALILGLCPCGDSAVILSVLQARQCPAFGMRYLRAGQLVQFIVLYPSRPQPTAKFFGKIQIWNIIFYSCGLLLSLPPYIPPHNIFH
jgi:hypothetical protein